MFVALACPGVVAQAAVAHHQDQCGRLVEPSGRPGFVTALGKSDTAGGWRAGKSRGGILMNLGSGEVVCGGLCMPHSPRWHDGRLWLLESGTGGIGSVDLATGRFETRLHARPGSERAVCLRRPVEDSADLGHGRRAAGRAPGDELRCGVAAVELRSGRLVGMLAFQTAVEENFDVQLLPGLCFPEVVGFQKDAVQHTFIVPRT
jgi:uncharacterized protein (TIGR03032 family)